MYLKEELKESRYRLIFQTNNFTKLTRLWKNYLKNITSMIGDVFGVVKFCTIDKIL